MVSNDEILSKLLSIEAKNEDICKGLIELKDCVRNMKIDDLQMRVLIEDVYDYIRLLNF